MCKEFHEKNVFFTSEKFLDLKMMLKQLPLKLPTFNELAFRVADPNSNILIDTVLTTYYRIYCLFFPKM